MPDLTLDLRYLKYAVQVAEAGSFRRAAERLSISQSTVSRRVQLFERQLGFSLFKRTRAGAGLTPEGERFLQQAVVGARYLRNAATEIRSARKLKTGLVRFGMLEAFPACPIINILSAFRNRHPTIEVKLEEGTSGYRKFNRPFLRVWQVGSGRASAALGTDRAQIGGSCVGFRHRGATQRLSA